ncbi:MAG: proton-conducting transporter membrane subunit [Candidatus Omnitrophota bacterium]
MHTLTFTLFGETLKFSSDPIALFFALFSTMVGFLIFLYSLPYTKGKAHRAEFYSYLCLFWVGMLGLVFSGHLILFYLFWEVTALSSWRLIGFYRKPEDIKAANNALLVTFGGSSLMLLAFILIYLQTGTFDLGSLSGFRLNNSIYLLILAGILSKSAIFPFNEWLPAAGIAAAPVTAFLHAAVLVKIGLYAFIRLFYTAFVPPPAAAYLPFLFIVSCLVTGFAALREDDFKRLLAYSTISQLSLIYFSLSLFTAVGLTGAVAFILAHAFGKSGLFLTAGVIEHETGERNIRKMGGYFKSQPLLSVLFLLSAFSVIGIPPFLGFWGKVMLIASPFAAGNLVLGFLGILAGGLTLIYLLRAFHHVFLGKENLPFLRPVPKLFYVSISALAFFSLLFGLWPNLILYLFR